MCSCINIKECVLICGYMDDSKKYTPAFVDHHPSWDDSG